ncbi:MAG: polyhydroxyalkanoic acid system family protein [Gammaproteobacteria bacterium]|jgi:putative polyhydroxyalkanoate system protein|nr:polyhydroxyalkanoic acid system family protein [Gammaproteobacteria bacterium]
MATIHIKRKHHLDNETVRNEVQNLADKLSKDLSATYSWQGDRLVFKRSGASGHIDISGNDVEVEIKLSLVLAPLKGTVEKTVTNYLDERLS